MKAIVLILFVQLGIGTCLFIRDNQDVVFLKDLKIQSQTSNSYPDKFKINLNEFNKNLKAEFVKVSNYGLPAVSYFSNGQLVNINLEKNHQAYRDQNGRGFATLFSKDGQFRMYARFYDDDTESNYYDIIPGNNRNRQGHFLHKRILDKKTKTKNGFPVPSSVKELKVKAEAVSFFDDELHPPKKNLRQLSKENIRKPNIARAVNGIPLNIDVEILAVTDPTIYKDHKMLLNTDDEMAIFQQIAIYYAHVFNGVNDKYRISFAGDPDLRLNIKLMRVIIFTNQRDTTWTDINLVGEPGLPKYKDREVILNEKSLNQLATALNVLNISQNYDHIAAFFNKDLWNANSNYSYSSRSSIVGTSWGGGICRNFYKYSVIEDDASFRNIYIIAHELGHNLGASHDGSGNFCNGTYGYLMASSFDFKNMANAQKFSKCSITSIKSILLIKNTYLSSAASCLTNSAILPNFVKTADYSKTGSIWDANAQCKIMFGTNAIACFSLESSFCQYLYCKMNSTSTKCNSKGPAADGTKCGIGKVCKRGICTI